MSKVRKSDQNDLNTNALKAAIIRETIPFEGDVELNDFAKQVASQFGAAPA